MTTTIHLASGAQAVVDAQDASIVSGIKWRRQKMGAKWYVRGEVGERLVFLHRHLLGVTDPKVRIDHANGDGLDNRRSNLRLATASQNAANSGRRSSCRLFKGVYLNGKRWASSITHNGVQWHLGTYDDPLQAAFAYDIAAVQLYGDFARCNTI